MIRYLALGAAAAVCMYLREILLRHGENEGKNFLSC